MNETFATVMAAAHEFFSLPDKVKLELAPSRFNSMSKRFYRGYFPRTVNGKEGAWRA